MRLRAAGLVVSLGLAALGLQRGEAAVPALYTAAQAQAGREAFAQHCASCHGQRLQGLVGPALKGPIFASAKAGYTVRDIFLFLSVNMPAYAPGSLTARQYLDIMSFLLQQNGFPAGTAALTGTLASTSAVPLRYHSRSGAPGGQARLTGGCPRRQPAHSCGAPRVSAPGRRKPLAAAVAATATHRAR
jgi:mono/diheme cytochrome c family protein